MTSEKTNPKQLKQRHIQYISQAQYTYSLQVLSVCKLNYLKREAGWRGGTRKGSINQIYYHASTQKVDMWQPSRALEWVSISRNPTKGPQDVW